MNMRFGFMADFDTPGFGGIAIEAVTNVCIRVKGIVKNKSCFIKVNSYVNIGNQFDNIYVG